MGKRYGDSKYKRHGYGGMRRRISGCRLEDMRGSVKRMRSGWMVEAGWGGSDMKRLKDFHINTWQNARKILLNAVDNVRGECGTKIMGYLRSTKT